MEEGDIARGETSGASSDYDERADFMARVAALGRATMTIGPDGEGGVRVAYERER